MSIIAATGLQAYNNALADFAKARNQVQKSASDIAGAKPAAVPGLRGHAPRLSDDGQRHAVAEKRHDPVFASGETQNVHEL